MLSVPAPSPFHGGTFRTELAAAGITVAPTDMALIDGRLVFPDLSDSDRSTVTSVANAHTGSLAPEQQNARTIDQRLADAMTAMQRIVDAPSPMTAAQITTAVKNEARAIRGLIRLVRNQLDSAD